MLGGGGTQKGLMSIVYGGIVFAIAMVFIVQFRPGSGQQTASLTQQCAANIRDRCVTPKEFLASLGLVAPRGADENRLRAMSIRRQVLEGIVERSLLVQDAKRLNVTISDDEINKELGKGRFRVSLPQTRRELLFYLGITEDGIRLLDVTNSKTKKFDYEAYKRVVRLTTNRSPAEFKEMQREEIIASRMREIVASRASVSEAEAFETYKREKSSAKIEYVSLHKDYFARKYLDVSPKAVETWTEGHAKEVDEAWTSRKEAYPAGCRKVRHILVQVQSATAPQGHPREEAQSIIEKARARIEKGESFEIVAAEVSEDDTSSKKGGDLGCFKKGRYPGTLDDSVFAQKKPGMLDAMVETPVGFHLVEIVTFIDADEAKAEKQGRMAVAKDLMMAMEVESMVADAAKRIREAASGGKSLQDAIDGTLAALDEKYGVTKDEKKKDKKPAKEAGDDDAGDTEPEEPGRPSVETSASFTKMDSPPFEGAAPGEDPVRLAFSIEKEGQVASDLVRLEDGYAVVRLKERKAITQEDFGKERDEYMGRMLYAKRNDLLVDYIARLREAAAGEVKISEKWAQEPKKKGGDDDEE